MLMEYSKSSGIPFSLPKENFREEKTAASCHTFTNSLRCASSCFRSLTFCPRWLWLVQKLFGCAKCAKTFCICQCHKTSFRNEKLFKIHLHKGLERWVFYATLKSCFYAVKENVHSVLPHPCYESSI